MNTYTDQVWVTLTGGGPYDGAASRAAHTVDLFLFLTESNCWCAYLRTCPDKAVFLGVARRSEGAGEIVRRAFDFPLQRELVTLVLRRPDSESDFAGGD